MKIPIEYSLKKLEPPNSTPMESGESQTWGPHFLIFQITLEFRIFFFFGYIYIPLFAWKKESPYSLWFPSQNHQTSLSLSLLLRETKNQREHADFRENPNWEDHHSWGWEQRHHRQCQSQDPGTVFLSNLSFRLMYLFDSFKGTTLFYGSVSSRYN